MKPSNSNLKKAIEVMGFEPINEIGQCFDATFLQMLGGGEPPEDLKLCHGIGIANMPGQEGNQIAHAWLEWGGKAYDCIWGTMQDAKSYRENFNLTYVVEYTFEEAVALGRKHDRSGPWDLKIKAVINE